MEEDKKNDIEKTKLVQPVEAPPKDEAAMYEVEDWPESNQADEEPSEPMGLIQCLVGVFISPVKTFRSLTAKTHLLWPFVILFVVTLVTTFLSMDAMESFTRIAMETALAKNPQTFTPEMLESQLQMSMKMVLIFTPMMAFLTPLIKGLVTHGTAKLFDGKGTMKVTLSVIALSYMIIIAGGVIRLPLMMASGTLVTFSPAMFLSQDQMGSAWYNLLMNFDLFTLWYLGVSAIGVKEVHRISFGKSLVTVLIPFGLILLMSVSAVIMEKLV